MHFFTCNRLFSPGLLILIGVLFLVSCSGKKGKELDTKTYTIAPEAAPSDGPPGMVWVPSGEFTMGALEDDEQARPDEVPAHQVKVSGFWMDARETTNHEFQKFVAATGYVTTAEKKPVWEDLKKQLPPGTPKPPDSVLIAASMVFTPVATDNLFDWSQWWRWIEGANWRHPQGLNSDIEDKEDHPVVQVSWDDARAYLQWSGKRFPTEAEWEYAARGALVNNLYPWGNDNNITVCGNTWQGKFPEHNTSEDGYFSTAPVGSYKPNGYGLYDMAGNVWEWTSDWYHVGYYEECANRGLVTDPLGASEPFDPRQPYMPQRVQRGGSFLCNESYCSSYRASARMHSSPDTGQDHVGFRGVMTQEMWLAIKDEVKQ